MRRLRQECSCRHDLAGLAITALHDVDVEPSFLHPLADRRVADAFDCRDGGLADARNRRQTGTNGGASEVDSAGTAQSYAAAELAPLQIEHVPQHPKQWHIPVDIDGSLLAIHLDRVGHRITSIEPRSEMAVRLL
ncbi:MAG: hypothetical protein WBV77_11055 [Solirubrobacteraceae bacterium]